MGLSRGAIVLAVIGLSFILPAAICVTVLAAPVGSVLDGALILVGAALWMAALSLVNWWEFVGLAWRRIWWAALVAGSAWRFWAWPSSSRTFASGSATLASAVLAAGAGWLAARALLARRHAGTATALAFPLRGGRYLVTDGGDGAMCALVNYHYGFGRHRASGVSASMRYAVDVVEVGRGGRESVGFVPRENAAYHIWERALMAPCDGIVVHVVDGVADNHAFGANRPYGVGNHVVFRCADDVYVVLGHMRCGSVRVRAGQTITAGTTIGCVGNSGWTERPHLHMQAMRSETADWWHGDPVPMRFEGRFPVRNQVVAT